MNKPLISIIVPCYNQAQYLDECLQSVIDQTYDNWECVIINDGSSDNTEEVTADWLKKDFRFKYINQINGGLSNARNAGIKAAAGEFILPLDADDKISENYTSLAVEAFYQDDSLRIVYCNAQKFGSETGNWNLPSFSYANLAKRNIIFCSAFFKKNDWLLVGGYDSNMIYGLEDWEFWIAILKNGGNVKCLDIYGFYYRIKENSMLKELNAEKETFLYEYLCRKHFDFFIKYLGTPILLNNRIDLIQNDFKRKTKSKKFVLDLFLKTFLGFQIFKSRL